MKEPYSIISELIEGKRFKILDVILEHIKINDIGLGYTDMMNILRISRLSVLNFL